MSTSSSAPMTPGGISAIPARAGGLSDRDLEAVAGGAGAGGLGAVGPGIDGPIAISAGVLETGPIRGPVIAPVPPRQ